MSEIMERERKEQERKRQVNNMELKDNENADHVMKLMKILAAKKEAAEYELNEQEIAATRLWCDF